MDDFVYDQIQTDAIVERIEQIIAPPDGRISGDGSRSDAGPVRRRMKHDLRLPGMIREGSRRKQIRPCSARATHGPSSCMIVSEARLVRRL